MNLTHPVDSQSHGRVALTGGLNAGSDIDSNIDSNDSCSVSNSPLDVAHGQYRRVAADCRASAQAFIAEAARMDTIEML